MPTLTQLTIYPIKGCRGTDLEETEVTPRGLKYDRLMMIVDADGFFISQRSDARLALITPRLDPARSQLTLSAPDLDNLTLPIHRIGAPRSVTVWNSICDAIDQGHAASEWLSDYLKRPARLVHMADGFQRAVKDAYTVSADDHTSFADSFPALLISQESLDNLNNKLPAPIPMNRFRPNLVVSGALPFTEDSWKRIRIGEVELAGVRMAARCAVPTIDQNTGEKSKEPTRTLNTYRNFEDHVWFGQHTIPVKLGGLSLGQNVEVIEDGQPRL